MRYSSRRKQNALNVMVGGIALVLISLVIEFAGHGHGKLWSSVSLCVASAGLVSGVTAYFVSRFD